MFYEGVKNWRTQFNEKEHIECLKKDCFHCEKIARQDLFFVVGHQMTPTNGAIPKGGTANRNNG
jgi:hypothetical protein